MRYWLTLLTLTALCVLPYPARAEERSRGLDIYFIDTEGGAATLVVTPQKESVLIDCGNPGARDADRIHKVATEQAGLKAIDGMVITHWHTDHYGGVARLARLLPIHRYYDHGIPEKLDDDPKNFPLLIQAYRALNYQEDVQETCEYLRKYHSTDAEALRTCAGVAAPAAAPATVPPAAPGT
jgi:glyoxylase-like metal-dependent hydrolase (beta-lactamase superfamily II)